ncbi:hypothetical protein ACFFRR_006595 [Megaselia abdita]
MNYNICVLTLLLLSYNYSSADDIEEDSCVSPKSYYNGTDCICPSFYPLFDEEANNCLECPDDKPLFDVDLQECRECESGSEWDGISECDCIDPSEFKNITNSCECPMYYTWNIDKTSCECSENAILDEYEDCICLPSKSWNDELKDCFCPKDQPYFNTFTNLCEKCLPDKPVFDDDLGECIPECKGGKKYSDFSEECECPSDKPYFDDKLEQCSETENIKDKYGVNSCPEDAPYFNEETNTCEDCPVHQTWDGTECTCEFGYILDADTKKCFLDCKGGKKYDETEDDCICPAEKPYFDKELDECREQRCPEGGPAWNDKLQNCGCSGNLIWNPISNDCECSGNKILSEEDNCVCPEGRYPDANDELCVCPNGKVWSDEKYECVCPDSKPMYNSTANLCEECPGKTPWYQDKKCLGCPSYKPMFNKTSNQCEACPEDMFYDANFKVCTCTGGRFWSESKHSCECPEKEAYDINLKECYVLQVCPEGYILNSKNQCSQEASVICPENTTLKDGTCVRIEVSEVKCPDGLTYNPTYLKCLNVKDPVCSEGTVLENGKCLEKVTSKPSCPDGYVEVNGTCIKSVCPEGFENVNGNCVKKLVLKDCPTGYIKIGNVCELPKEDNCPADYKLEGGVCKRAVVQGCPTGFELQNNFCVRPKDDGCENDFKLVNGKCVRKTNDQCEKGFVLVDGICKIVHNDDCPDGFILSNHSCVRKIEDDCPEGYTVVNNRCRRDLDKDCPKGFELVDNLCKRVKNDSCPSGYFLHNNTCYRQTVDVQQCPPQHKLENGKCIPNSESITKACSENEVMLNKKCYKTVKTCPIGYSVMNGSCTRSSGSGVYNNIYNYVYSSPAGSSGLNPGSISNVNNVNVFTGNGKSCGYRNCNRH